MKIFQTVTELWGVQEWHKKQQKTIKMPLRNGKKESIRNYMWHFALIHIPVKFHEDIYNCYCVMVHTKKLRFSKGHNSESKKGLTVIIVWGTIYISIK